MSRVRWQGLLVAVGCAVVLAGFAGSAQSSTDNARSPGAKSTIKVGLIFSRTGALSGFGTEYETGFRYGLLYATHGTGVINGHPIQVTYVDDQTDAAKAVAAGKDLIGQGYKILAGSTSSGVGLQMAQLAAQNNILFITGSSASDALTGINRNTFRAGRQSYQDVLDAANALPPKSVGKKVVVFAEDTAFGASNFAAVTAVFGGKGHTVSKILVPFNATDLTPFAQQLKNANADLVFVAWAGPNSAQMWQALQQQGVTKSTKVITGLANRETYASFGPTVPGVQLISHYVYNAPKNKVNDWLVKNIRAKTGGDVPNLFTPDGFVTAQMIAQAITKADGDDVDKMIAGLENWQFLAPKGKQRIRAEDHAMIQPMFQVELVQKNGKWDAKVVKTVSPGNVAPPIKHFP